MTPEQIQQAVARARAALEYRPIHLKPITEDEALFARAVLALTEQQPEPVSCDELADAISDGIGLEFGDRGEFAYDAAVHLLSRYTITRKPVEATDG